MDRLVPVQGMSIWVKKECVLLLKICVGNWFQSRLHLYLIVFASVCRHLGTSDNTLLPSTLTGPLTPQLVTHFTSHRAPLGNNQKSPSYIFLSSLLGRGDLGWTLHGWDHRDPLRIGKFQENWSSYVEYNYFWSFKSSESGESALRIICIASLVSVNGSDGTWSTGLSLWDRASWSCP